MLPDCELVSNHRGSDATPQIEVFRRENHRVNLPSSDLTATPFRGTLGRPLGVCLACGNRSQPVIGGHHDCSAKGSGLGAYGCKTLKRSLYKGDCGGPH